MSQPREGKKGHRSDHQKLIGAREWLEGMRKVHDTLSFRKKQIQEVMTRLFDDKNDSWKPKVKPESREIWIACNTRRVWEACRDYGNALRKERGRAKLGGPHGNHRSTERRRKDRR